MQQFSRALDAEAKALRSIHVFLSKTLKNLEVCECLGVCNRVGPLSGVLNSGCVQVERTCLDVMARTVSSGCSDTVLRTSVVQHGPEMLAEPTTQTEKDACSRFCENLLPTCELDGDENQEDLHSILAGDSPTDAASFFPETQPQRSKRRRGERRGKRKKAHVSQNAQQANGAQDVLEKEFSVGEGANGSCEGAHDEVSELEAAEGLDLVLSSALQDAKELLAEAPVGGDNSRHDRQGAENPAPEGNQFGSDGLFMDEGLAAIQDMNAILDSD